MLEDGLGDEAADEFEVVDVLGIDVRRLVDLEKIVFFLTKTSNFRYFISLENFRINIC